MDRVERFHRAFADMVAGIPQMRGAEFLGVALLELLFPGQRTVAPAP
jgi:hypothetical protein